VAFPGVSYIWSATFSPDGRTAYCQVNGQGIDLWAAGLSKWPGLLGGGLGAVLLIYLLVLSRILRRSQVAGEPHCRRCNYHLISQAPQSVKKGAERVIPSPGTLCPECGVDLARKRPVRGKPTIRRLWPATAALLLCAGAYAWLFFAGVPRSAGAPNAPQFWSRYVDDLAEKYQIDWLLAHRVPVSRVMCVDTVSGVIARCLRTARAPGGVGYGMKISPGGRFLAVADSFSQLSWVNVSTGWATASMRAEFRSGDDEGFVLAVEGSDDDPSVYYRSVDQKTVKSRLIEWHPRTGQQRILVEEPAFLFTYSNGTKGANTRRYALIHRPDGIATVSAPDFLQAYQEQRYVIVVRSPASAPNADAIEREITVPGGQEPCSSPLIVSPDGSHLFVQNYSATLGYDANTGVERGELTLVPRENPDPGKSIGSPAGGRLFVPVHRNGILVRDVEREVWSARLTFPAPFIVPKVWASADDRWLAAAPFRSTGNTSDPFVSELFLYDLAPLARNK
jgi:hypothetical protein